MRKAFIILTTLFSFSLCAQNITWQNVNLNVPFENTQAVFNLIDGFYSYSKFSWCKRKSC